MGLVHSSLSWFTSTVVWIFQPSYMVCQPPISEGTGNWPASLQATYKYVYALALLSSVVSIAMGLGAVFGFTCSNVDTFRSSASTDSFRAVGLPLADGSPLILPRIWGTWRILGSALCYGAHRSKVKFAAAQS